MKRIRQTAVFIVAIAGMSVAQATPIIVDNEADFLSLVDDVTREGFESYTTNVCSDATGGPSSIVTTFFTVTSFSGGTDPSWLCVGDTEFPLPAPTEGRNALVAGGGGADGWSLSFALLEATNAVYFELTDAVERGDAFISIEGIDPILVASRGSGGLETVSFGIIFDDSFTSFNLINTGVFDGWGIDNMIFATVPEPGTLALLGIGLFGMALTRRRKQPS